jgi:hypothetical protein
LAVGRAYAERLTAAKNSGKIPAVRVKTGLLAYENRSQGNRGRAAKSQ